MSGDKVGCCGCCVPDDPEHILGDTQTTAHYIFSTSIEKVSNSFGGTIAWSLAGLLNSAAIATILLKENNTRTILDTWIYALVMFILASLIVLPFYFIEDTDTLAQELEVTVPKAKANMGDPESKKLLEAQPEQKADDNSRPTPRSNARKFVKFVETNTDELFDAIEVLITQTTIITCAQALNDAIIASYSETVNIPVEVTSLWIIAIFIGFLSIFINFKLGQMLDNLSIKMYDTLKTNDTESTRKLLLQFGTKRRVINVNAQTWPLVWSWALRDAIKVTLISAFGGDTDNNSAVALWMYTVLVTLVIGFGNSIAERYYILYPKPNNTALRFETKQREYINNAISSALTAVVGLAWYDAIAVTFNTPTFVDNTELKVKSLWSTWIGFTLFTLIISYLWERYLLTLKIKQNGVVNTFFNVNEKLFDPDNALTDNDIESNNKLYTASCVFLIELMELLVECWTIASGSLLSIAISTTFVNLYSGLLDSTDIIESDPRLVRSLWASWGIATLIGAFIVMCLANIVKKTKQKRNNLLKDITNNDEMKELSQDKDKTNIVSDNP